MKLEARSFSVTMNNADRQVGIGQRITLLPENKVRVTQTGTFPVEDFTRKQFAVKLPIEGSNVELTQQEDGQYEVGRFGKLRMYDNAVTYTSRDEHLVLTAPIPSRDRTNAVCTGMVYLGLSLRIAGIGH